MTTRNKAVFAATGLAVATGALLFGVTSAQAANTTPSPSSTAATECRGPAASLSADQCASFQTDMKAARDAVFTKYGLTPPTGDGQQGGRHKGGGQGPDLSSLSADQQTAFKTDMDAVHTQRDAVLAKYGITAPTEGQGREAIRDQVSTLSTEQQAALKADMQAVRDARDAVFAKYGITAPTKGGPGA